MLNLVKSEDPTEGEGAEERLSKVKSETWWRFLDAFRNFQLGRGQVNLSLSVS